MLPLDGPALAVLGGVAVGMALAFLLARWLATRPDPELGETPDLGAGVALALMIAAGSLLLWFVNPFAALLTVPAAHLWMLRRSTRPLPARRVRLALIAVGAAPALLVALYYMFALELDPLSGLWYLLMLVTGHSVGIVTVADRLRDAGRCARCVRPRRPRVRVAGVYERDPRTGLRTIHPRMNREVRMPASGRMSIRDGESIDDAPAQRGARGVRRRLRARCAEAVLRSWMLVAPEPVHGTVGADRTRPPPREASPTHVSAAAASAASRRSGGTVTSSS